MNVLKFPVLHDNIYYRYILCVTFCQFVLSNYLQFTNSIRSINLNPQNNEIYEITTNVKHQFMAHKISVFQNTAILLVA